MRRMRNRLVSLAAAILSGMMLSACGGAGASPAVVPTVPPPAPTATATPAPTASGQTACDHPYLPTRTGASWSYQNAEGNTLVLAVEDVQGDAQKAEATMTAKIDNLSFTYHWRCTASDGIVSFDYVTLAGLASGGLSISDLTLTKRTGVFLPPASQLVQGATWPIEAGFQMTFGLQDQTLVGDVNLTINMKVTGTDPANFNGQSVDGLQVHQENQGTIRLTMAGATLPDQPTAISGDMVLGRDIGIISQSGKVDLGSSVRLPRTSFDLVSYRLP